MPTAQLVALLSAAALGYLLGSIPFGVIVTRLAGVGDLRKIGSGNIGTTNVLRTGRKELAAATLLGDMLKATVAVLVAWRLWGETAGLVAGAAAFFGHVFPVWLRFRGGKGVATYLGALIGVFWPVALAFAAIWIGVAAITRYSSASALAASLAAPILLAAFHDAVPAALVFAGLSVALWLLHHENIGRLLAGRESRIGQKPAPVSGAEG
ncbi:glycerol-3-phosphate 1-O-acyltransferase PlsY [Chelatococcus sambhunathii]|uniref:Glycerol-3-phosphate acyltransferase n=1 Tax=Chelatococcus sambhunathii TaxID=363953 RepID=A0ABU1DDE0_9HYPH|nr:glycerol-3-phosphate 1-O-acyltransferase PlsY [Chelatococcus sambhunathii]MDR4306123.1 glycerol-3-phosphate 1-O-acyltransferase PlsY [Chelatococcus sambhunathii]